MPYCSQADIESRLSSTGLLYPLDDDNDGTIEAADTAIIAEVIAEVDAEINMYLTTLFHAPASLAGNVWLKIRAVDLACLRLCERKGASPPDSILSAYERSIDLLERAMKKEVRIPGAVYPMDSFEDRRRVGLPMASNPGEVRP